jgi:hypothetical protein
VADNRDIVPLVRVDGVDAVVMNLPKEGGNSPSDDDGGDTVGPPWPRSRPRRSVITRGGHRWCIRMDRGGRPAGWRSPILVRPCLRHSVSVARVIDAGRRCTSQSAVRFSAPDWVGANRNRGLRSSCAWVSDPIGNRLRPASATDTYDQLSGLAMTRFCSSTDENGSTVPTSQSALMMPYRGIVPPQTHPCCT